MAADAAQSAAQCGEQQSGHGGDVAPSGERDGEAVVELASVVNEGGDRVGLIGEQCQDDRSQRAAEPFQTIRRGNGTGAKAGQIGPHAILAAQKAPHQGLRRRVLMGSRASSPERGVQTEFEQHETIEENAEVAGTMLASRQTEIRQERDGLVRPGAAQPNHGDPLAGIRVG